MKLCPKCGTEKPAGEFHRNKTSADGLERTCKSCRNAANRASAEKRPDHYRAVSTARSRRNYKYKGRDPHKPAHNIVRSAIRSGNLVRPTECEACGSEAKVSGHHEDYGKPLELRWLCSRCHIRLHAGLLTLPVRGGVSPSGKERGE